MLPPDRHRARRPAQSRAHHLAAGALLIAWGACTEPAPKSETKEPVPTPPSVMAPAGPTRLGATRIARLSRSEYLATVQALLGVDVSEEAAALPPDAFAPFDHLTSYQHPSSALVQALSVVAEAAAKKALATPQGRAALLGCTPASVADEACLKRFITEFGRRALRRPLAADEVADLMETLAFARQENDFYVAVATVVRSLLQDLEFIYRVEIGTPVGGSPGVVMLGEYELASRLSFFFWGQGPDDVLLGAAGTGKLRSTEGIREQAARLLADPRAQERIERFHALWLGYESLPHEAGLSAAFRAETDATVRRVVFENNEPWFRLFTAPETYVNRQLGELYGLPAAPGDGFGWIKYPDARRRGILSHGSLLSNGAKGDDTSPTLRGKFVLERLLCTEVPPPPPGVNADVPPADGSSPCKQDRYQAHSAAACAGCHTLMDPVGFGLENYDLLGRFRSHDINQPSCTISGKGQIPELGAFSGPAQLGALLTSSDKLGHCLARHVYEFAVQREIGEADAEAVAGINWHMADAKYSLRDALLALVDSGALRFRRVEPFVEEAKP